MSLNLSFFRNGSQRNVDPQTRLIITKHVATTAAAVKENTDALKSTTEIVVWGELGRNGAWIPICRKRFYKWMNSGDGENWSECDTYDTY